MEVGERAFVPPPERERERDAYLKKIHEASPLLPYCTAKSPTPALQIHCSLTRKLPIKKKWSKCAFICVLCGWEGDRGVDVTVGGLQKVKRNI